MFDNLRKEKKHKVYSAVKISGFGKVWTMSNISRNKSMVIRHEDLGVKGELILRDLCMRSICSCLKGEVSKSFRMKCALTPAR